MTPRRTYTSIVLALLALSATTAPTTAPASPQVFDDAKAGVHFTYPAGWLAVKGATSILDVVAPPGNDKAYASLTLDVPHLPPHFPGMITPGMVESGYVSDLKKNQIHDAKVLESVEVKVPGCKGRRVKCAGHQNNQPMTDVAVILIHNDRVYIFSCDGDDKGYTPARAALDGAVATIQWK